MAENVRELALEVLLNAEKGQGFLDNLLHAQLLKYQYLSKRDRAFLSRICEGVNEYRIRIDYVVDQVSKTPIRKCKPMIRCILRMGAYQILFMDSVPDSAACNECVKLAKKHGFARLTGFVNGVLRNVAREKESIGYPTEFTEKMSVTYSLPHWLVQQWMEQYESEEIVEAMAKASVKKADLTVRFQKAKEACIDEMVNEGLQVCDIAISEAMEGLLPATILNELKGIAARIEDVDYLSRYDTFQNGDYTIQDVSSMLPGVLAVDVLKKTQSEHPLVLDMCAAPGGKTMHVASYMKAQQLDGKIIARDKSEDKIDRIEENLERMQIACVETEVRDALDLDDELVGQVDVVILDAPCSGLGVLARKKEIAYGMSIEQEQELEALQREMLEVAKQYVKKGGTLVYSTCTVNKGENEENTRWFLEKNPEFTCKEAYQMIPGLMPTDGFYVVRLEKK